MIYVVCSVRDRCANVYAQPFFVPTVESSLRAFRALINSPDGGLPHTNPDDFDLFHLGSYDDQLGTFSCLAQPVQLALGRDMIKPSVPLARA